MTRTRPGLFGRVSIALRLMGLVFALVGMLLGISIYLTRALDRVVATAVEPERLGTLINDAHAVDAAFAELRYRLTELSVNRLVGTERDAAASRETLQRRLDALAGREPAVVQSIRRAVAAFDASATAAIDAYSHGERVIGNVRFAEARLHGQQVSVLLDGLEQQLTARQHEVYDAIVAVRSSTTTTAMLLLIAAVLTSVGLTVLVLRSFLDPLAQLATAVEAARFGNLTAPLPPAWDDELGAMTRAVRLFREGIAERAQLELKMEEQRQLLSDAIECIGEGFVLYDAQDRLVLWNSNFVRLQPKLTDLIKPGTLFRALAEAAVQRGVADLAASDAASWLEERLSRHRRPNGPVEYRFGDRWVQISEQRMTYGGTVAIYSDITASRRRQEELEEERQEAVQASEVKSQFLANMSHELRTPLNAIIGYSQLLQEEAEDAGDETALPDLRKIEAAGKHLLGLINGILDLSKVEAGRMDVFIEAVNLSTLVEEVRQMIAPLAAGNGNELIIDCPSDSGAIRSDFTKLKQSLLNLLSNACKFTENGKVLLTVRREPEGRVSFAVADSGIGMTEEQQGKLFQAFVQADGSTTRRFGGSGLGLALTRSFARMLGGDVTVSSRLGEGSTFTLMLPVDQPTPADAEPADDEATEAGSHAAAAPASAPRILVVDDDAAARQIIGTYLGREGYQVLYADSGRDGLQKARELRPDVITLDILMPQVDGWSVLASLKADPVLRHIPVVLVTADGDKGLGFSLGAAAWLSKPVDRTELIDVLKALLQVRSDAVVLVVDDDPPTCELTRRTIESLGHSCALAGNGREALGWMAANPVPAIILLDLLMPEMDGVEFLIRLRARTEWRNIPVVVVTAKQMGGAERQLLEAMAQQIVTKGHNAHRDLARAVREVLAPAAVD